MNVRLACCVGFAAVIGALTAACIPGDCGNAESHCVDAHTMETCGGSVDAVGQSRHSHTSTCPASTPFCVDTSAATGDSSAACHVTGQKAPECAANPNNYGLCVSDQRASCRNGYLFENGACDADHVCVVGSQSHYALCALSSSPDPVCSTTSVADRKCDGDTALDCYDGFLLDRTPCAVGECNVGDGQCNALADAGALDANADY